MKALFRSLPALLFLLAVSVAGGQDESRLEKLKESFETRRSASTEQHAAAMEKLRESYRGALERLQERAQKSGKLEDVLPVRDEIQRLDEKADPLPPPAATASPELKQLRETYDKAVERGTRTHSQEMVSMSEKMVALLEKESAALTKAGKIEDALAAKTLADSIRLSEDNEAPRSNIGKHRGDAGNGEGMPLIKAKWTVLQKSGFYIGVGDGQVGDGAYPAAVHKLVAAEPGEAALHFVATAPSRIEFVFPKPVTRIETELFMAAAGDVLCRLIVNDRVVSHSSVSASKRDRRKWSPIFPATNRVILEIDENGANHADWLVLLSPTAYVTKR